MKSNIRKSTIIISFGAVIAAALALFCIVGCSQNSQQNKNSTDPIVGQGEAKWKSTQQADSQEVPVVFIINADGKSYGMTLANTPGYQITSIYPETWEKQDNNIYSFTTTSGENYKFQYNKESDTVSSTTTDRTYTRLDPIVGIGTGVAAEEVGAGNSSIVFKSDGTAISTVAFDNGSVDVYNLTGKKTSNSDYDIYSGDRKIRTYTVSEDGNTITTDDNRTKKKCFTDSYYLVSVVGSWYKPGNNYTAVFNADGTGFWNNHGKVANFTGHISANGVELTYKDGVDADGKDLAGVSYTGKYDREKNCFPSPNGSEYIRPTSSIPGLITFK